MVHRTVQPREARRPLPDAVFEARHADLSPEVRPLIENVYRQIEEITDRYGVADTAAFVEMLSAATQRELFAAEKDVVRLSQLVERLEYLWKEHKEVERAFDDRKLLVKTEEKARIFLLTSAPKDRAAIGLLCIEAELALGKDVHDTVEDMLRFPHLVEFNVRESRRGFYALGRAGKREEAQLLWECHERDVDFNAAGMKAAYATGLSDEFERNDMLAEAREGVPKDMNTLMHLAEVAYAEHAAGLDTTQTIQKIEALYTLDAVQKRYDSSMLAELYATLGDEERMRAHSSGVSLQQTVFPPRIELGIAYAEQGKFADAERIWKEIRGSTDVRPLAMRMLPEIVRRECWDLLDDDLAVPEDYEKCLLRLLQHNPELVSAYYAHVKATRVDEPLTEAVYARFLAMQEDEQSQVGYLERRNTWVTMAEEQLATQQEFLATCAQSPDAADGDEVEEMEPRGIDDASLRLAVSLAHYIVAAHTRGEPTESLMKLMEDYVRAMNTDAHDINLQTYNDHLYSALVVLVEARCFTEAQTCVSKLVATAGGVTHETSSRAGVPYVLTHKLRDAIDQEAASRAILQSVIL